MAYNCKCCGGDVNADGNGFKCPFCGAKFASAEELIVKRKPVTKVTALKAPAAKTTEPNAEKQQSINVKEQACVPAVETEMASEDIYEKNCRGVVEILTESGRASGFLISQKGLVLTNAHAVLSSGGSPCSDIYVKHAGVRIKAKLIAIGNTDNSDPHNVDLALLAMESVPEEAKALTLGESSRVRIGQHVYYIGNSKGEGLCMTAGIVSDINRKLGERYFIMTDAATNPGNSGGPLFNEEGNVIGVHVSARIEADGMKYAIPVDAARVFLNTVEDRLELPHDTLADNLIPRSEASTESLGAGVVLTLVLSGISLLVKNIEFIKEIIDTIKGN